MENPTSEKVQMRCAASPHLTMLPSYFALLQDKRLRPHVQRYAVDQAKWFTDFSAAWIKLQELGSPHLQPHPASLTYASSCVIPAEWYAPPPPYLPHISPSDLRLLVRHPR